MDKIEEFNRIQDEIEEELGKAVKPKNCIVCQENIINPLYPDMPIHPLEQQSGLWNDGAVAEIRPGFGSRHDMESYYIAICDPCLTKLASNGMIESKKKIKEENPMIDSLIRARRIRSKK